jgi:acetylglutamate kinase
VKKTHLAPAEGRTVIKLGGSLLDDATRRDAVLRRLAERWHGGEQLIVVHGGGKHIDAALAAAGIPKRTHAGLRITDDATLPVVVSVLAGSVNKMLVAELTKLGVRCAGISGCDGATLVATKHPDVDGVDFGHVGLVTYSNRTLVGTMLNYGILPIVSSIAQGADGSLFNVNADAAASAVAVAHAAEELLFLTDVEGLLDESGSVVEALDADGVAAMLASPFVRGGMRPKLQAALDALRDGVGRITIGAPDPDQIHLTTGGTHLVAA